MYSHTFIITLCKKTFKFGTFILIDLLSLFNLTHAKILTWLTNMAVIRSIKYGNLTLILFKHSSNLNSAHFGTFLSSI